MAPPSSDRPATTTIHGDAAARQGAVVSPIYQASTFAADSNEEFLDLATRPHSDEFYMRYGTPNHTQVASVMAALEGAEGAVVTASGMGALSTLALALLHAGDHVVVQRSIYPGTTGLVAGLLSNFGVESTQVSQTDEAAFAEALRPPTRLVLLETPSNPLLALTDIRRFCEIAHERGALVAVDNTVATPINQRPLDLGADLVWHSATKYLGGHSDLSAGVVAGRGDVIEQVWRTHLTVGAVLGPFDAWLLMRGIRTLELRVARHNENAMAIASALDEHPDVTEVHYPGLAAHPQHELACEQMRGFGGLLSFSVVGGAPRADRLLDELRLTTRAASLGSVHTIANRPSAMWVDKGLYQDSGVSEGLIRLSVGIEAKEDLIEDLGRALKVTAPAG